ncbi:hypothetical protein J4G43_026990 [Bradyrhizobium barranii subsp. barranii]|uniref:Uncharacterized protein n=1 Tax=Bradyrhizobium barranii subsp. barranii TaxID=2823807 RepID=A0A939M816_9BRAD|nr:hypothetical protein [Bradyrhizobium barranii]UEM08440.1 hypothetical protein J4G43_026990 [Bradyrhizobium barranii subsp. barranii]
MKLERNVMIGGQTAKLVRDFLGDASNSDGFYIGLVNDHLLKAWWRTAIEELIEAGKMDRRKRGLCLRKWTWALRNDEICGARLPKVPEFMAPARKLIEALLAHELIHEDSQEGDGRTLNRVTDKGNAVGMKILVRRMGRAKKAAS